MSAAQISAYTDIYSNNARPVQPKNDLSMIVGQMPTELPETGSMNVDLPLTMASILAVFSVLATSAAVSARRRRNE